MTVDHSDLYPPVGNAWEGRLPPDEADWWSEVVSAVLEDGRSPSPNGIISSYKKNFPEGENEPTDSSVRRAIRREAKKAGVELHGRR